MTSKALLRREIDQKRHSLAPEWIKDASQRIVDRLLTLQAFREAKSIALYKAIGGEVDLDALFPVCWEQGKRTAIPVFNAGEDIYELAEITTATHFTVGNYGIREPVSPTLVSGSTIDLMVVPGVAFDHAGNRLGRGGGYYDRLLKDFAGISVAVAFDLQICPQIPCDSHDIPVGAVVTETKLIKVLNEH